MRNKYFLHYFMFKKCFFCSGNLGKAAVTAFNEAGWKTISADSRENSDASSNVKLTFNATDDVASVLKAIGDDKVGAVINVAGGWVGGSIKSVEVIKQAQTAYSQSVDSSLAAANIAANAMSEGGLLVLTGALAATGATAGMIGYGLAKAAVHQLAHSVADSAGKDGGLPAKSTVVTIAPVTLDTPQNRSGMPDANFDDWTPLDVLAKKLASWANGESRPTSGKIVAIKTKAKETSFEELK